MYGPHLTLVTGATSGIGKVIATTLSEQSAVLWSGRREDALNESCGSENRRIVLDLDLPHGLESAFREWRKRNSSPVESLVYCAGLFRAGPLRTFAPAAVSELMRVNFESAAELCRLLVKRELNGTALKTIVMISSVSALRGVRGYSAYAASKGALEAFARSLAVELAPSVRVNVVCPGAVSTERSDPIALEAAQKSHPLGVGRPADVASAVSFLLSDQAKWITGQRLVVDGGWTC
jgi:NAD(P)-dependent dehydrogenase (short-subunit alcohol dehydrogenase family)